MRKTIHLLDLLMVKLSKKNIGTYSYAVHPFVVYNVRALITNNVRRNIQLFIIK